ncbi:MAG TPA: hypothetical protein V6C86_13180 [Oculatellaceae cyanobacterium]
MQDYFGGMVRSTVGRVQRQGIIKGTVEKIVAEGFPSEELVVELVLKALDAEPDDQELLTEVQKLTKQQIRQHLYIQNSWVGKTDCDKIDDAFSVLGKQGIFARQNVAVNEKSGRDEIRKLVKTEDAEPEGFVFFTAQDTENAVEFGEIAFSFGAFNGDKETALKVGAAVVKALCDAGLHAEWSGELYDRIQLAEIDWKKRRLDLDEN